MHSLPFVQIRFHIFTMPLVENITLPTSESFLALEDNSKKITLHSSEGDLRALSEKGRELVLNDLESRPIVIKTTGYDDFPDGGLRAWLVVVGVRNPFV